MCSRGGRFEYFQWFVPHRFVSRKDWYQEIRSFRMDTIGGRPGGAPIWKHLCVFGVKMKNTKLFPNKTALHPYLISACNKDCKWVTLRHAKRRRLGTASLRLASLKPAADCRMATRKMPWTNFPKHSLGAIFVISRWTLRTYRFQSFPDRMTHFMGIRSSNGKVHPSRFISGCRDNVFALESTNFALMAINQTSCVPGEGKKPPQQSVHGFCWCRSWIKFVWGFIMTQ